MTEILSGPLCSPRNWSADEGEGSIHDDETAAELGFRGGTVAGDIHMNQFPPLLVEIFGEKWFEQGNLSLNFKNATVDREKVRAFAQPLQDNPMQTKVWMEREDGLLVCTGTAALSGHSKSELRMKDYRPCEPSELKILHQLYAGMSLGTYDVFATTDKQFTRYDNNLISDPMTWYRDGSPWGDVVAAPCTIIEFLWGYPMQGMRPFIGDAVSLFGAMEIGYTNGPFLLNRQYRIESEIVCVGQSPQTEYVWYESKAYNEKDELVATMLMQSRAMKASSPTYQT